MVIVSLVAPAMTFPFLIHSYEGAEPPPDGVAVKNADSPEHKFDALVDIETAGMAFLSTVILNVAIGPKHVL